MTKFPVDAPVARVKRALETLGFQVVREGNHISLERQNDDGKSTTLTIPTHPRIKSSTLRAVLTQTGIPREDFLRAYDRS